MQHFLRAVRLELKNRSATIRTAVKSRAVDVALPVHEQPANRVSAIGAVERVQYGQRPVGRELEHDSLILCATVFGRAVKVAASVPDDGAKRFAAVIVAGKRVQDLFFGASAADWNEHERCQSAGNGCLLARCGPLKHAEPP